MRKWLNGILIILYLFTRLYDLMSLPMFVDEASHILWAMFNDNRTPFALGKTLGIVLWRLFLPLPAEPLVIVRVTVVIAGLITLITIIWIGTRLFSWQVGTLSGLVYFLLPYALFFNRLALTDSFQVMFGTIAFALSVNLVQGHGRRTDSLFLTAVLVAGPLAKMTGALLIAVPLLTAILLVPKHRLRRALSLVLPATVMSAIVMGILLRLGFGGQNIELLAGFGVDIVTRNIGIISDWFWVLFTPLVCILLLASMISRDRRVWLLTALIFIGPVFFAIGGKTIFSRYTIFSVVPASLLVGQFIAYWLSQSRYRRALVGIPLIILLVVTLALPDWTIITHPESAALPPDDHFQYVTGWPSGYGIAEAATYLTQVSSEPDVQKNIVNSSPLGYPDLGIWYALRNRTDFTQHTLPPEHLDQLPDLPNLWLIVDSQYRAFVPKNLKLMWHQDRPDSDAGLDIWH